MKKIGFCALALLFCAFQTACLRLDGLLYNPKKITEYKFDAYEGIENRVPSEYDIAADKIKLMTLTSDDDGKKETIYAEYVGDMARIATDTIILYAHGNAQNMDLYWQRVKLLANVGGKNRYGVMTFDYRGYGLSEGTSTESSMYADADACLQWLKSKGLTSNRLVFYGFSLGTASATKLTAEPRTLTPAKLALEAPFASAEVMAQDASGLAIPGSFVTNLKINNAEMIKKVNQPLLWLHGVEDDFVAMKTHGEVVFKNYKGTRGTAVRVEGANHSTVPNTMGYPQYVATMLNFISK